jgi:hypothetical protein
MAMVLAKSPVCKKQPATPPRHTRNPTRLITPTQLKPQYAHIVSHSRINASDRNLRNCCRESHR